MTTFRDRISHQVIVPRGARYDNFTHVLQLQGLIDKTSAVDYTNSFPQPGYVHSAARGPACGSPSYRYGQGRSGTAASGEQANWTGICDLGRAMHCLLDFASSVELSMSD